MDTPKNKNKTFEISDSQITSAIAPFGVHLSEEQISGVRAYVQQLLKWNRLMSLTAVTDPIEIVSRHFGESFFAASLIPVENCRLADVGTGAGFPGLPLKILHPELQLTLIESNKKKSAFLAEIVRTLKLSHVEILTSRFEEVHPGDGYDFITARAVGGFPNILEWAKMALTRRGHILLWVGGEDLAGITNVAGWIWNPPERIPESLRRYVLIGRYIGEGK